MAPHVWKAGPAEAGVVAGLLVGFRDFWAATTPTREQFETTVRVLLDDPDTDFLLAAAASGAAAAGFAQVRYRLSAWTGADDAWLEDLYVDPAARSAGLGAALVEAVLARARARGCRRVELDVNEENTGACRFYARHGFSLAPKPPGKTLLAGLKLP
jgi:ribosomal protein S18 acetylase RimI-like enzyme